MEGWLWRLQLSVISYQLSVISGNLHCEASAQISVLCNYTAPSARRFYHEGTKSQRHEENFYFPLCALVSLVVFALL